MRIFVDRGRPSFFGFAVACLLPISLAGNLRTSLAQTPRPGGGSGNQGAAAEIETSEDGQIVFTPIELKTRNGFKYEFARRFHREWLALENGLDVMFDGIGLYAIREPGVIDLVRGVEGGSWEDTDDVQWDGRYVWVSNRSEKGRVAVLAGDTLAPVAVFSEADGLPGTEMGCLIAPLGEGVATVVGSRKDKCAWIANLILGHDGDVTRKRVDVFHEACRIPTEDESNHSRYGDVEMAFDPKFAFPVFSKNRIWVVVGRHCARGTNGRTPVALYEPPLIVDPYQREITLVRKRWPFGTVATGAGDRLYLGTHRDHPLVPLFGEALPPDFMMSEVAILGDPVQSTTNSSSAIVHDGMFHSVGYVWTTVDISTGRRVRHSALGQNQRIVGKVFVSNHYGLVHAAFRGLWQVSFP